MEVMAAGNFDFLSSPKMTSENNSQHHKLNKKGQHTSDAGRRTSERERERARASERAREERARERERERERQQEKRRRMRKRRIRERESACVTRKLLEVVK